MSNIPDVTASGQLEAWRRQAAAASGQVSEEPTYQAFEQTIARMNLTGDVLDFGAGLGNFARRLQAMGRFRSVTAFDISPRPEGLPDAIAWGSYDLNDALSAVPSASFDTVIAAEVVEHLENPRALAREWFRLLRPGGTLILSTPNNESWRSIVSLVLRGHFVLFNDESYPAHLTALLRKDIQRFVTEAGFDRIEFLFTDEGSIPKLRHVTWQAVSGGLLKGIRFSDNILAIGRKPGAA